METEREVFTITCSNATGATSSFSSFTSSPSLSFVPTHFRITSILSEDVNQVYLMLKIDGLSSPLYMNRNTYYPFYSDVYTITDYSFVRCDAVTSNTPTLTFNIKDTQLNTYTINGNLHISFEFYKRV